LENIFTFAEYFLSEPLKGGRKSSLERLRKEKTELVYEGIGISKGENGDWELFKAHPCTHWRGIEQSSHWGKCITPLHRKGLELLSRFGGIMQRSPLWRGVKG
jgi:hypothetical protein